MGSPYGFPPTRSKRSFLWITGRYSFRMGSPFSGQILMIWSRLMELLQLGSWKCFFRTVLGMFGRPVVVPVGSEVGGCLHFWCGLWVYPSCQQRSRSWPFFCWPCCLSPSPRGSVGFGCLAVFLSPGRFLARLFRAWWLTRDFSGSRTSREEVLACIQGASDSLRHPPPGGVTKTSVFGIAVRVLLWATPLSHGMVSSQRRVGDCPSLPWRVAVLPLWLSCSDVLGPPVLLSYYVVYVIPCGPGALSSLSPFLGCHSGSSELAWGFRGTPSDIRVALSCFRMCSSSSSLPWLGVLGVSMLCLFLALFPGARLWCPLLSLLVLWRTFRPLPYSSVCRLYCTGPTNARQSQRRLLYPVRAVKGSWSPLASHRQRCERFPFCRKV